MQLAQQLATRVDTNLDLDSPAARQMLESLLDTLTEAIVAVTR